MKNDRQQKDLKEMAKRRKMNLAAQSFIETLHFAVPILRFFKWLASAQPALFIKKHPAGAECFFHDWMTEKLLIMPLSFSQTFSHFFVSK
ncbi:hypothetical protein ES071_17155 [Bacillus velezensis]|nr:hypothetical protein ES071_17155 [Bacillus velezensis]